MPDDAELLRRYLEDRSEEAFTELVRRHVDFVYGAALRMTRSAHRAEDVTQSVFTDLCRKAKALAARRNLAGWLYISTRYASVQLIRRETRRARREAAVSLTLEPSIEAGPDVDWSQLAPVLDGVLGQLAPQDRDAILLRFFKNASFGEIGSALRLSENAARMRVDRALEKTRKLLVKSGFVSTLATLELALANQPAVAAPVAFASALPGAAMAMATTAAALAAATTGFFALMNATKITLTTLVLATVIGIGASLELRIRQTQEAVRVADGELPQLQRQLADQSRRAAAAENDRLRLQKSGAEFRTSQQHAADGRSVANAASSGPDWKAMVKDPAYQATIVAQHQARMHQWYADLYRQLQFSPDQVQRFEKALSGNDQANLDVGLSAVSLGLSVDNPMLGGLYGKNKEELATDLQGLVTVPQLEAYDKSRAGVYVASQLGAALRDTDAPLTLSQADSLAQMASGRPESGDIDWTTIMAQAPTVLSPAQTAMLGSVKSGIEYWQQKWMANLEAARAGSGSIP